MEHWVIIVNPVHRDSALRVAEVTAVLERAGVAWSLQPTTAVREGGPQAAGASAGGAARLVVIGGDGTVRAVAAGLLAGVRPVPVVVVPAGTANLLALNLGLQPGSVSARRLLASTTRAVDVGRVRLTNRRGHVIDDVFLIAAGMGEDARTAMAMSPRLKRVAGWLSYPVAGIPRLGSSGNRLSASWTGRPTSVGEEQQDQAGAPRDAAASGRFDGRVWSALVGNAGRIPAGIRVFRRAHLTSGDLELLICTARTPLDWVQVGLRGFGMLRRDPAPLAYRQVEAVVIEPEAPAPVQLDGDVIPDVVRMEVTLLPHALSVVV
ncbi:diacylglycerol kinase family protein [Brevibacterium daeguense]|uniref:Diacylglycerol kinase family protein n=1 Tax=Brevibacterium daeguense TaxID=909936 RepID=A0ABP8EJN9_9MICO